MNAKLNISLCGIGPGHPDYLLPAVVKAVQKADIIVGGRRQLELFKDLNKPEVIFNGKVADLKEQLLLLSGNVAIVVSGDTGFYSLRTFIKREFPNVPLQIEPGISSYQYLYAKVGLGYEKACLASVHGKEFNFIEALSTYESVFLLTDRKINWQTIAQQLVDNKMEDCTLHIGNNLSYEDEEIISCSPKEALALERDFKMCAVVIESNLMSNV